MNEYILRLDVVEMDAVRIADGICWVEAGVRAVENQLRAMGLGFRGPSLKVQYMPDEGDLTRCVEFGRVAAGRPAEGSD